MQAILFEEVERGISKAKVNEHLNMVRFGVVEVLTERNHSKFF